MRSPDNIEKLVSVRKPNITTGSETDKRILDDSFVAMDKTIRAKSAQSKPNIWKIIVQNRITKLAAAAVIILAISFLIVHRGPNEQADVPQTLDVAKSPTDMLTAFSLSIAYRKGGMQAIDSQCEKAFEMLGQQPSAPSVKELLAELLINNRKGQNHENR